MIKKLSLTLLIVIAILALAIGMVTIQHLIALVIGEVALLIIILFFAGFLVYKFLLAGVKENDH